MLVTALKVMDLLLLNNREIGFIKIKHPVLVDISQAKRLSLRLKEKRNLILKDKRNKINKIHRKKNRNNCLVLANIIFFNSEVLIMVGNHLLKVN